MEWTEIIITVPSEYTSAASDIATMTVPYGFYTEDYSSVLEDVDEIAHTDLIDEELLARDRTHSLIHIYISPEENPAEAVSFISARLDAENIPYELSTGVSRQEDWINNWKKYFRPMPVGRKLYIRPAWIDEPSPAGRAVLTLEPGTSFGSGTHETTRLVLETMEDLITPDTRVLDVGCGSGILSVSAMLLGAKRAVGVDIDPLAVKTAEGNADLNGLRGKDISYVCGDLTEKTSGKFDLILANITADAIIRLVGGISAFMEDGAVCVVSGIIEKRAPEVIGAIEANGFRVMSQRELNGWVSAVFTK